MTAYLSPGTYTVETVAANAGRTGVLSSGPCRGLRSGSPRRNAWARSRWTGTANRVNATWGKPC